jgi:Zn-dependent peptidase ImmA (M78 family)
MPASSTAREKAQALRQRLGLGDGYVDIFDVLRQLGFEVYRRRFDDGLEGALTIRDGVPFVFVNSQGSLTRQRLTAAHELGHYELGEQAEGTEILEETISGTGNAEWDVFRFARHLLMDEVGVRRLLADISDEEQMVAAVARTFVVSPVVSAIHLREIGMISAATKTRLKAQFDDGSLKPSAFLGRFGYGMGEMNQTVTELAPSHIQRSLDAYSKGILSPLSLAEVLQQSEEDTRAIVREAGLEALAEEASGVRVEG